MTTKPTPKKKKKTKATAQPKVVKNDIAVSDSELTETNDKTKGLALDDIKAVIDKDLVKAVSLDYSELNDNFDLDDEFEITTQGREREKKISEPRIEALPENRVIEVLAEVWDSNRESLIKQGFSSKNASRLAGCTYNEFMPYLNVIIPDNYKPRNKASQKLKSEGSADWKLTGVNKEAVNRRMKQLMAMGSIIIYKVNGKFHLVPTQSMVKNVNAYKGSIWHINQIRNILYNSEQWNQGSNPYINLFKLSNPLDLTTKEFEQALGLDKETLRSFWNTDSGFDTTKLKEALGTSP